MIIASIPEDRVILSRGDFDLYRGTRHGRRVWFYRCRNLPIGIDDHTVYGWKSTLEAACEIVDAFSNPAVDNTYSGV